MLRSSAGPLYKDLFLGMNWHLENGAYQIDFKRRMPIILPLLHYTAPSAAEALLSVLPLHMMRHLQLKADNFDSRNQHARKALSCPPANHTARCGADLLHSISHLRMKWLPSSNVSVFQIEVEIRVQPDYTLVRTRTFHHLSSVKQQTPTSTVSAYWLSHSGNYHQAFISGYVEK